MEACTESYLGKTRLQSHSTSQPSHSTPTIPTPHSHRTESENDAVADKLQNKKYHKTCRRENTHSNTNPSSPFRPKRKTPKEKGKQTITAKNGNSLVGTYYAAHMPILGRVVLFTVVRAEQSRADQIDEAVNATQRFLQPIRLAPNEKNFSRVEYIET